MSRRISWRNPASGQRTPDEVFPRSPDEREALFDELYPEDYFHLSIPVMDTYPSTQFRSRRLARSPPPERAPSAESFASLSGTPGPTSANSIDLRNLNYVGTFDQNLMCPICHCPLIRPVTLTCDHVFCTSCLSNAFRHQERGLTSCPTCRGKAKVNDMKAVPKLIDRMLDELIVNCPLQERGCLENMARGTVQDHVDYYCGFSDIECPWIGCELKVQRRTTTDGRCLHSFVCCKNCSKEIMERDLEDHQMKDCEGRTTLCPYCKDEVICCQLDEHTEQCPDATFPCSAAIYGCDHSSRREDLDRHNTTCPLIKIGPFLEKQRRRLDNHEAALKHLQKKSSIYQASLKNMQEVLGLGPTGSPLDLLASNPNSHNAPAPFDSTAAHLLSLHESLREEVTRVTNSIAELDARTSTMVLNESLRTKEDLAHTNAVLTNLRVQFQWLMSSKLQSQQRAALLRSQSPGAPGPSMMREDIAQPSGTSEGTGVLQAPVRRLSDSTRQDTKL